MVSSLRQNLHIRRLRWQITMPMLWFVHIIAVPRPNLKIDGIMATNGMLITLFVWRKNNAKLGSRCRWSDEWFLHM